MINRPKKDKSITEQFEHPSSYSSREKKRLHKMTLILGRAWKYRLLKGVFFHTLLLTFLLSIDKSEAAFITFTNAASWSSAAGATPDYSSTSVETFSSVPANTYYANASGVNTPFGPVAFNGFAITGFSNGDRFGVSNSTLTGIDNTSIPAPFAGQNFLGWGNLDGSEGPTSTYTFSSPTYAFGFNWFNTDVSDTYSVTVVSASETSTFVNPPFSLSDGTIANSGFLGFVSTSLITSATIQTSNYGGYISTEGLDNFRVASAAVPEPGSYVLSLFGSIVLYFVLLRRRNAKSASIS